jgi:uncharacterized protein Veg
MASKNDILNVKQIIQNAIGSPVVLQMGHGTKEVTLEDCVITSAYPSVFTVQQNKKCGNHVSSRTYSYSYSEVATNAVKLSFANDIINNEDSENENKSAGINF